MNDFINTVVVVEPLLLLGMRQLALPGLPFLPGEI